MLGWARLIAVFYLFSPRHIFCHPACLFCQWIFVFKIGVTCRLCLFVDVASWSLPQLIAVLFFKLAM